MFVEHRRGVHSGAGAASGRRRQDERARGGQVVRAGSRDGAEDAAVFGSAGLPAAATGAAAEAGRVGGAIDQVLEDDKLGGRKQRHTAKRIFERLRDEHGYTGGYTIVKDYVRLRKLSRREMFVPLTHPPGDAQADFGEVMVVIAGVERKAHYLAMDLPQSDDSFVMAFPAETTEAFLEGHNHAFACFGGVPRTILYDNTKIAVARILGDGTRMKTRAFTELQSHYLFAEKFGRPGKGNDKGKVEGLVGYARRNFMVPRPRFATWEELNAHLLVQCQKRRERKLRGHQQTIGMRFEKDKEMLLSLPAAPNEACDKRSTRVTSMSLVRYRGNDYSVPVAWGRREVLMKGFVHEVVICAASEVIARHPRSYEREDMIFNPLHYLALPGTEAECAGSGCTARRVESGGGLRQTAATDGSAPGQEGKARVRAGPSAAGDVLAGGTGASHR